MKWRSWILCMGCTCLDFTAGWLFLQLIAAQRWVDTDSLASCLGSLVFLLAAISVRWFLLWRRVQPEGEWALSGGAASVRNAAVGFLLLIIGSLGASEIACHLGLIFLAGVSGATFGGVTGIGMAPFVLRPLEHA